MEQLYFLCAHYALTGMLDFQECLRTQSSLLSREVSSELPFDLGPSLTNA